MVIKNIFGQQEMKELEVVSHKVIYLANGDITAVDICSNASLTPIASAFEGFQNNVLHEKLHNLIEPTPYIAIVCYGNFGGGSTNGNAIKALKGYNLTIIAKSIDQAFFNSCDPILKQQLIQCPTLNAGDANHAADFKDDDQIEIQTFKLINKGIQTDTEWIPYLLSRPIEIIKVVPKE